MDTNDLEIEGHSQKTEMSETSYMSHLALDLGGSLIKLVYFSKNSDIMDDTLLRGRLHFATFKYTEMNDCLDFISSKMLHLRGSRLHKAPTSDKIIIKATGAGAYKFSSIFEEKLGICIEQEDEMDSLVAGASFLLKTVHQEAFTYMNGQKEYVQINNDLYPYMNVNIGTGVTTTKVEAGDKYEPIGGTDIAGGTFWGLGRLLTKCKSFDELLALSERGDNRDIDILIGDLSGGLDYTKPGFRILSTFVASCFGKAMYDNKELEDYKPEDIACSLLRMISNNIGEMACLNAFRFGHKRIIFSGSFIRSNATMEIISTTVDFWSGGNIKAVFLQHQGFIGAIGTFLKYRNHDSNGLVVHDNIDQNGDLFDEQSLECSVYAD